MAGTQNDQRNNQPKIKPVKIAFTHRNNLELNKSTQLQLNLGNKVPKLNLPKITILKQDNLPKLY